MDNYGYMVVCFNNRDEAIVQAVFTQNTRKEIEEIIDKAFIPNYHRVGIYRVREIDIYG